MPPTPQTPRLRLKFTSELVGDESMRQCIFAVPPSAATVGDVAAAVCEDASFGIRSSPAQLVLSLGGFLVLSTQPISCLREDDVMHVSCPAARDNLGTTGGGGQSPVDAAAPATTRPAAPKATGSISSASSSVASSSSPTPGTRPLRSTAKCMY